MKNINKLILFVVVVFCGTCASVMFDSCLNDQPDTVTNTITIEPEAAKGAPGSITDTVSVDSIKRTGYFTRTFLKNSVTKIPYDFADYASQGCFTNLNFGFSNVPGGSKLDIGGTILPKDWTVVNTYKDQSINSCFFPLYYGPEIDRLCLRIPQKNRYFTLYITNSGNKNVTCGVGVTRPLNPESGTACNQP